MKKLFIISYSFPPSNAPAAQRPYTIAKYLGREGYNVSVLSCSNQDSSLGLEENKICTKDFKLYSVPGLSLKLFRKIKSSGIVDKNGSLKSKNSDTRLSSG